jgi:hypothetical protein
MPLKCGEMLKSELEEVAFMIGEHFEHYAKHYKSNINIISKAFWEATLKAYDKLAPLSSKIDTDGMRILYSEKIYKGTLIFNGRVFFYYIDLQHSEHPEVVCFYFTYSGTFLGMVVDTPSMDSVCYCTAQSEIHEEHIDKHHPPEKVVNDARMTVLILFELFKQYAEIENVNLPPKKVKRICQNKYHNDTPFNISHLDSKWFTNLVQSNEFGVRGHFRLQPYGTERHQKKLIWINDFIKHGYTSKARILTNN